MGISERKERGKEDLKKRILNAARELFIQKGFEETSIRNIAEKIEYSPTTIYLYYKDKDAIFHALHSEGFVIFNSKMSVLQYVSDPLERLKAMGKIYIDFALENSDLYDLMFTLSAPMDCLNDNPEHDWNEGIAAFNNLKSTIEASIQMGYLPATDPEIMTFFIWSSLHGMCSLQIHNRCAKVLSDENRDTIVLKGYTLMVNFFDNLRVK
jgi:AcrR family transcriptional regulator